MKRRILSIITALALCLSLCPTWALAAEADPALCPHHREHTEDCGYTAPAEGQPCGHEHTAECYALEVLPDTESGDDYEIGADTENLLDCQHTHDSECGYAQADPGQPCGYECRICPIEDLIDALPGKVTEDNAEDVRGQLDEILALFSMLTEDEQEQIDLSRCYELQGALDGANDPDPAEGHAAQQEGDEASVTIGGATTYYATIQDAWTAAKGNTATVRLLADVTRSDGLTVSSGSRITFDGGEHTIEFTVRNARCSFVINSGGTLAITSGTVVSDGDGVQAYDGTVTINGGTITGGMNGIRVDGGTTTISGGTVTNTGTGGYGGVYVDGGMAHLMGGSFSGANAAVCINPSAGLTLAGLLARGYIYKQDGSWLSNTSGTSLTGSVTVQKIPLTIDPNPQSAETWYFGVPHTLAMNAV